MEMNTYISVRYFNGFIISQINFFAHWDRIKLVNANICARPAVNKCGWTGAVMAANHQRLDLCG